MINHKDLILGTSLWGWTVKKKECYKILDTFYDNGYRWIDTATNYPINSDKKYFRYAENLLAEWIKNNDINDLKIISKIGSVDNLGGENVNLSYSFLLMNYEYYLDKFQSCLKNIMVHWDNRDSILSIESTIDALKLINQNGIDIGLSGIKNPEHYFALKNILDIEYFIEVKHNIFSSSLEHYRMFYNNCKFIVYGINASGIKINGKYTKLNSLIVRKRDYQSEKRIMIINKIKKLIDKYNDGTSFPITSFNHIGMIYAFNSSWVDGIIVGPSSLTQLTDSLLFFNKLKTYYTKDIFDKIRDSINYNEKI